MPRVWLFRVASLVTIVVVASCGRSMFVPPAGPGQPAPEAATAWSQATAHCRDARTFVGVLRVSGRAAGDRLWPVTIETALTHDGRIYFNAIAGGRTVFVLAGRADRAALWLRDGHRIVRAQAREILEAIVGISIESDRLLALVTGCVAMTFDVRQSARHGSLLTIETHDARVHLTQQQQVWRTRAGEASGLVVEYGGNPSPAPAEIWIWSARGAPVEARLSLRTSDVQIGQPVPDSFFEMPAGARDAEPLTIEELRAAGPLRGREPEAFP